MFEINGAIFALSMIQWFGHRAISFVANFLFQCMVYKRAYNGKLFSFILVVLGRPKIFDMMLIWIEQRTVSFKSFLSCAVFTNECPYLSLGHWVHCWQVSILYDRHSAKIIKQTVRGLTLTFSSRFYKQYNIFPQKNVRFLTI